YAPSTCSISSSFTLTVGVISPSTSSTALTVNVVSFSAISSPSLIPSTVITGGGGSAFSDTSTVAYGRTIFRSPLSLTRLADRWYVPGASKTTSIFPSASVNTSSPSSAYTSSSINIEAPSTGLTASKLTPVSSNSNGSPASTVYASSSNHENVLSI